MDGGVGGVVGLLHPGEMGSAIGALLRARGRPVVWATGRWAAATRAADAKGWRWIGEMEQIAAAMAARGLPDGFHHAAAAVYQDFRDERAAGRVPGRWA